MQISIYTHRKFFAAQTFCVYKKPTKPHLQQGELCSVGSTKTFMLPGAISICAWQNPRVVILPYLVQKCQTSQPCFRTVRWCLVPMLGPPSCLASFPSWNSPCKYWHSSTLQHILQHKKWWGCEEKKHKILESYNWAMWKFSSSVNFLKNTRKTPHEKILYMWVKTHENSNSASQVFWTLCTFADQK